MVASFARTRAIWYGLKTIWSSYGVTGMAVATQYFRSVDSTIEPFKPLPVMPTFG